MAGTSPGGLSPGLTGGTPGLTVGVMFCRIVGLNGGNTVPGNPHDVRLGLAGGG